MDAVDKLNAVVRYVEEARSMPMSASCVVNRAELLELLADLRASLPQSIGQADAVIADRQGVLEAAQREAERVVAEARALQQRLVSEHEVGLRARADAAHIVAAARDEAAAMRQEVDDYVEGRLANFEVVLEKIMAAVHEGREKMHTAARAARGTNRDANRDTAPHTAPDTAPDTAAAGRREG